MATLYLELYQGDIPDSLSGLPGAQNYNQNQGVYWLALTTTPNPGSEAETIFQSAEVPANSNTFTHGTDTLATGTQNFVITSLCIWHPKQPPYNFRITIPDGSQVTLNPDFDSDDEHAWFCEAFQNIGSIGIYVIEVGVDSATQPPVSIDNSAAMLNPDLLPFTSDFFEKQPLLKINGFEQNIAPECPVIETVEITGCAPGQVEFLLGFDQFNGIDQLIWTLGDGTVVTLTLSQVSGNVEIESISVQGNGTVTNDQIEIIQGSALVLKLIYEYQSQSNFPPDYLNGSVFIIRTNCGVPSFTEMLQVPICGGSSQPACPDINGPDIQISDECVNGQSSVSFSAVIASDYYGGSFRLINEDSGEEIDSADLNQSASINDDNELVLSASIELSAGNYRLFCENSCSSSSRVFTVVCAACPEIRFLLISSGRDCINGLRPNNFNVEITSVSKGPLEVQLVDVASGEVLAAGTSSNGYLVISGTKAYPEGQHSVRVVIVEPENCSYDDGSDLLTFSVLECPDDNCPDISIGAIDTVISPNCVGGIRSVAISADVTIPADFNGSVDAQLSDENSELESQTGVTQSFGFSTQRNYAPGEHSLSVDVVTDEGCRYSRNRTIDIRPCTPPPWRPPRWVPTIPDWLCLAWLVFNILLMLAVGVAIGVAACFWGVTPVFITALSIAIAGGIILFFSFIAWVLLCGWKPNVCPFARWLPRIISTIGFIFAGLVLIVAIIELIVLLVASSEVGGAGAIASLPCFMGAVIEFAYFSLLAFIIWEILLIVGCQPTPITQMPELPDPPD